MTDLLLHHRRITTIFDLLGDKENDITFSTGWALAKSEVFLENLVGSVFPTARSRETTTIYLQEHAEDGGYTDIEIETNSAHIIIEAKRGWDLPRRTQLNRYARRLKRSVSLRAIVVVAECSPIYAKSKLPDSLDGKPVVYLSWKRLLRIARTSIQSESHTGKQLLRELCGYMEGLMSMQNQTSNMVYVVSLGADRPEWSTLSWIDFVRKKRCYFHPIGIAGWPKEPPNYLGFRYGGKLQSIHHVEKYQVVNDLSKHIPEIGTDLDSRDHFLYKLGPAIIPDREVRTGNIYRNGRVWAAIDLLLTSKTISEARDLTKKRMKESTQ
ncbi:MAG TPA: hypothetical protein VJL59_07355 [Anaerolineales bacterium]|nr:hypothetical protein [Anaerolineales bacterium]HLB46827.1 hypothetical protein [Anaerolineales bacterium]